MPRTRARGVVAGRNTRAHGASCRHGVEGCVDVGDQIERALLAQPTITGERNRHRMQFAHFDHLVLTVESVEASVAFYTRLGFEYVEQDGRHSMHFAQNKINLHPAARPVAPFAACPTPGSGDFCIVVHDTIDTIVADLDSAGVAIEVGPVRRNGAQGPMTSVYLRDPDGNLVEFATYVR